MGGTIEYNVDREICKLYKCVTSFCANPVSILFCILSIVFLCIIAIFFPSVAVLCLLSFRILVVIFAWNDYRTIVGVSVG